jgi:flagellar motor switch protein FliN/FliY
MPDEESIEVQEGQPVEVDKTESENPADNGVGLLYDVELDATLQFGSKEMQLREVLELGPGDVVELDRHIAEPVDLVVGDRIVARGEVVVASGNFALRITEVATPQRRLESIRCLF